MPNKEKLKYYFLGGMAILAAAVWCAVWMETPRGLTVAFLDVGQGDAVFIESPTGNQILLDGGANKKVLSALGKVMPFFDRSLDMIFLSHADIDHFGGLVDVLERYKISSAVLPSDKAGDASFAEFKNILEEEKSENIKGEKGEVFDLGGGAYLEVLFPPPGVALEGNDSSIIARLSYGKISFLLMGDTEKNMESYLASAGALPKANVLKIGHHGSRTSTSEALLGYAEPEYAVISVGADNKYGHPHQETLGLLSQFNIPVLRTDQQGTIVFQTDGESLKVK